MSQSNKSNLPSSGGYQNLLVYQLSVPIYDLTVQFCNKFIDKKSRTNDQMVQAARSGKQNIVEASLEKSEEANIKLTSVARASFGELIEDYKDYLRINNLEIWDKNDKRIIQIRQKIKSTNWTNWSNKSNLSNLTNLCLFINSMLTLINMECFLLDRLLRAQQQKFVREGGFRENLFQKRRDFKNKLV